MPTCLTRAWTLPSTSCRKAFDDHLPPFSNFSQSTLGIKKQVAVVDLWTSITTISQTELPLPYIHPMVKRSADSLSKKSLEMCTESLGSETGSDGFTAAVPVGEEFGSDPPKFNHFTSSIAKIRINGNCRAPLPPALPSSKLQMRCHRQNGKLVVEAVSVPSTPSCFRAERQGGRLLLTLSGRRPCEREIPNSEDEETAPPGKEVATETAFAGYLNPYISYRARKPEREQLQEEVRFSVRGKDVVPHPLPAVPCRRPLLLLKETQCIAT